MAFMYDFVRTSSFCKAVSGAFPRGAQEKDCWSYIPTFPRGYLWDIELVLCVIDELQARHTVVIIALYAVSNCQVYINTFGRTYLLK